MTCNSCVQTIQNNVSNLNGVESVSVSLKDKEGRIIFFPDETNEQALVTEIEDMGFDAFVKAVEQLILKDKTPSKSLPKNTKEIKFNVYGMTCQSCVRAIQQSLSDINGYILAEISVENNEAMIKYNSDKTDTATLKQCIEDCGFEVYIDSELNTREPKKISIRISGMTFPSCVDTVRQTLQATDGVMEVNVELDNEKTEIWYQPAIIHPATLIKLIQDKGFEASIIYPGGRKPEYKLLVISIEGMTCNSCVKSIEETIGNIPGVKSIKVSLQRKTGEIVFNPDLTADDNLKDAIDDMGFEATIKKLKNTGTVPVNVLYNAYRICTYI